ncbi:outer membrane protein assembly factor BamA [bacterium]|nr:outer membrane protein assembly factor BamA [bacterium]
MRVRFIWFAAIACIIAAPFLTAQSGQLGEIIQLSVSGNQTAEASVIKLSSGLKEGQEASLEDIKNAIKQLWELGLFSDIQIVMNYRTTEGLFLTIKVEEYPRLEKFEITGNKKLKKEEVEKELGFFRRQVISPSQIARARKKLLKAYAEKGFTLANVKMETRDAEKEGRVNLDIHIDEGRKVQIQRIRFFGNTVFKDKILRKQMKKTKEDRWWRGADFKKMEYEEDRENILNYYRNHGYRDAEILRDSLYYDIENKDMFIDLWVREGRCYYFGDVTWEGNELFKEAFLNSLLDFKTGDAFSQEKFEKTRSENVGGAYYDLGYIYAQISPRETLRHGDTLDVHFIIDEKNPVRIRKIHIGGNTRTKDRVIRREVRLRPGMVFSKELLLRSHRDLMMLNYFSNVIPDVLLVDEEHVDLSFKVEEKSTDTANLSAGWSEMDRLIGSVGLGMNNLFGNGQQLSLDWNFGRYYRSFSLGFTEPWFLNTPTVIGASVYDIKRDAYYIGYSQSSRGLTLHYGRRFSWPDNYFRGDWTYRIDETALGDFSDWMIERNPNNIAGEDWPLISSGVTQKIQRNSLDQVEFPTRGSLVSLETELTGGIFGGNVGYHKHIFSAEFFVPIISNKLIFMTRAQAGFMDQLTRGDKIQYMDYFFIGGSGLSRSTPLRGYDDPLAGGSYSDWGGKTMLKTTFEIRFPLIPNPTMYGMLFTEGGNTWLDLARTDPFDLRRSVGIGARIFMPMIGMIGFDYAYGFDYTDKYGNKIGHWKPHFVFGRSF